MWKGTFESVKKFLQLYAPMIVVGLKAYQRAFSPIAKLVTVQRCIFLPAYSGQEVSGVRPMKIQAVKRL